MGFSHEQFLDFCSFWAALHDLGKFTLDFQGKIPALMQLNLGKTPNGIACRSHPEAAWRIWDDVKWDIWSVQNYSSGNNIKARIFLGKIADSLEPILTASFGHHGGPTSGNAASRCMDSDFNTLFPADTKASVKKFAAALQELFPAFREIPDSENFSKLSEIKKELAAFSFPLSGLIILSDWTASSSDNFHYKRSFNEDAVKIKDSDFVTAGDTLKKYWKESVQSARNSIKKQGLQPARKKGITQFWKELFPELEKVSAQPSPLQKAVIDAELNADPELFIIEDAAGGGKTEAALILTAKIMQKDTADGFYFALPGMATSNGMFNRLQYNYKRFYEESDSPSLILAHSGSRLHKEFQKSISQILPETLPNESYDSENWPNQNPDKNNQEESLNSSSSACSQWISDRSRKAFLAQVGVGSADQAMLAVMYSKHNTLRMYGLSKKVLIIDEVHAYDEYMNAIINNLI